MADPIQLEIFAPQPVPQPVFPEMARSQITSEQVNALINLIATANPSIITLPDGKQFSDIKSFNVIVLSDGNGLVNVKF